MKMPGGIQSITAPSSVVMVLTDEKSCSAKRGADGRPRWPSRSLRLPTIFSNPRLMSMRKKERNTSATAAEIYLSFIGGPSSDKIAPAGDHVDHEGRQQQQKDRADPP